MSDQILCSIDKDDVDKDDVDKDEGTLTIERPAQKNAMNDWVST